MDFIQGLQCLTGARTEPLSAFYLCHQTQGYKTKPNTHNPNLQFTSAPLNAFTRKERKVRVKEVSLFFKQE